MNDLFSAVISAFCLTAYMFGMAALICVGFIVAAFVMACLIEGFRWSAENLSPLKFLGANFLFFMLVILVSMGVSKFL